MSRHLTRNGAALAAAVAVTVALALSCRTAAPRPRPTGPTAPASVPGGPGVLPIDAYVPAPVLRVGTSTEASRVSVAADAEVVVWGASPGDASLHRSTVQRATFSPVAAAAAGAGPRFRVQVASLAEEAAAKEVSTLARDASGLAPSVRWNAETRTYQVRVGEYATREEAKTLAGLLGRSGLGGAWILEEAAPPPGAGRMRLIETGEELAAATITPSRNGDALSVDGATYRGLVEVRPNDGGTLTVVNVVNVEDYLRGVVPNELSPQGFPHIEALKAQAVAARTYALRNRGQFRSKGYDICATPACQVYRGKSSEDALSDRAVEETRGIVASYHGDLINALYTSTCGGHTEDGQNMFEGEVAPYLKGVRCTPENRAWATIRTAAPATALGDDASLTRDAALLVALGVLEPKTYSVAALKGPATDAELKTWTSRLLSAVRRKGCEAAAEPPLNRRGTFFQHLVGSLCWEEREKRLLAPDDSDYLLQVEDRAALQGEGERLAAALLVQEGILSPFPDNTLRAGTVLTRSQAVTLLARAVERAGSPEIVTAEFRTAAAGEIAVKKGEGTEAYPLDPRLRLFRALDGSRLAASEVTLAAGDKVTYILQDGRVTYLEAQQSRLGASADRTSRYYRWEVRMSPAEVAQAAARYGRVGAVRDVVPQRTGVSGRVVELAIKGTEGDLMLRGLKIRWGLGLRENLFVVDRETDARGAVERFVFTGKGWGHGVGLCQVGAYGMALSGAAYEDILRHYYNSIILERAY